MKLDKNAARAKFDIKVPIWRDGGMVGLATHKIQDHNEVVISAKNSSGVLYHPNPYYIAGAEAIKYTTEPVKKYPNIHLFIIPIADLEPLELV